MIWLQVAHVCDFCELETLNSRVGDGVTKSLMFDRRVFIVYAGVHNRCNSSLVLFAGELVKRVNRDYSPAFVFETFIQLFIERLQKDYDNCKHWGFIFNPYGVLINKSIINSFSKVMVKSYHFCMRTFDDIKNTSRDGVRLQTLVKFQLKRVLSHAQQLPPQSNTLRDFEDKTFRPFMLQNQNINSVIHDWMRVVFSHNRISSKYLIPLVCVPTLVFLWHRYYVTGPYVPANAISYPDTPNSLKV